ncbi:hypothetical protein GGI02_001875 [Coemansia sp. RSA 2322]|nr:hypothetical protein GGI02_001875 [Coemansia sp. RSA 2322]
MYFELSCGECQAVIGRRYITTVEEIDGIRNAYTLDVGRIITYELGKCLGNKAGNCEAPPPEFYTSVALHEDLVLVKSNVAAIAAKLQKLEQSLARGGGSAVSPRNLPAVAAAAAAAGGSRKRPQQQAQGYNSEIYHVDPSKRNNR